MRRRQEDCNTPTGRDGDQLQRATIYMKSAFGDLKTKDEKFVQDNRFDIIVRSPVNYFVKTGMADFDMLKRANEDNNLIKKRFKIIYNDIDQMLERARDAAAKAESSVDSD